MQPILDSFPTGTKKRAGSQSALDLLIQNIPIWKMKGNHSFHFFIIPQSSCAATDTVPLKIVSYFILIPIRIWLIMSITKNKGCGVALLNKYRHSSCPNIISVIFCNNVCQVLLWQFDHLHILSWLAVSSMILIDTVIHHTLYVPILS